MSVTFKRSHLSGSCRFMTLFAPTKEDRLADVHMQLSEESMKFAFESPFTEEDSVEELYAAPRAPSFWRRWRSFFCPCAGWLLGTQPGFNSTFEIIENDILSEEFDNDLLS